MGKYISKHIPHRVAENAAACSLIELLAAVVGGEKQIEIAAGILEHFGGDIQRLYNAPVSELAALNGVGQATAVRIKAALALAVKVNEPTERPMVRNPGDAAAIVQYEMALLEQEHFKVILLNTRHGVLAVVDLYRGTVNSTNVEVGEVFKHAVRYNAAAIIVAHNHPSGDPTPSPEDIALTRSIVQAGILLGISVLDHIIIGSGRWVSLKERGLGFNG